MDKIANPEDMPLVRQFDIWLNERIEAEEIVRGDLILVLWSIVSRLRMEMTHEPLHILVHRVVLAVEQRLQRGEGFVDPKTLEPLHRMLPEEKIALGRDSFDVPDFVPDDLLNE